MAHLLSPPRRGRGEQGAALVASLIIVLIVFALGAAWLQLADHQSGASTYDVNRQHAIDAADAGLAEAVSALTTQWSYGGATLKAFSGGAAQYEVAVAVDATNAARRVITAVGYAPTKVAAASRVARTLQQVVELNNGNSTGTFGYALFSDGALSSGASGHIIGDVYANGDVTFDNAQTVTGNVVAQGALTTGANVVVTGNITVGGSAGIDSSSSRVNGNVVAGGTASVGGTVNGSLQAGGAVSPTSCGNVSGSCVANSPPPALTVQNMPAFIWDPANYTIAQTCPSPSVAAGIGACTWSSAAEFLTWARSPTVVRGVHYVTTTNLDMRNPDQLTLNGDLTLVVPGDIGITKEPLLASGTAGAQFSLISTAAGGTLTTQSSFVPASSIHMLFYAANHVDLGNHANFSGAVFGRSVDGMANVTVRYVPLSAVGFTGGGVLPPASSSVRNVSIREVSTS